jgi:hypothetical protein
MFTFFSSPSFPVCFPSRKLDPATCFSEQTYKKAFKSDINKPPKNQGLNQQKTLQNPEKFPEIRHKIQLGYQVSGFELKQATSNI